MSPGKVFGISLPRTGTRSLAQALELLGYRAAHGPMEVRLQLIQGRRVDLRGKTAMTHEGFWFLDVLQQQFPDCLFLYVERDVEDWLDSWERKITDYEGVFRPASYYVHWLGIFGRCSYSRNHWRRIFHMHRSYVEEMARGGCNVSWVGHDWPSLCGAVSLPEPGCEYPHLNDFRGKSASAAE